MAARKEDRDMPAERGDRVGNGAREMRRAGEQMGEAAQAGSRLAERGFGQAADFSRQGAEQMRSIVSASARTYRDISDFSRGDMDALMQTGARIAKGMQDMSWEMMQYTQNSMKIGMQAANEMMGCRSVEDMMQVQRDFIRDSVDVFLQESAKLLQMTSSVAGEAVSPITQRIQNQ